MFRTSKPVGRANTTMPGNRWGRGEVALALTLAGACLALSLAALPTYGAASTLPAAATESAAEKKDRLVPYAVVSACSSESWGNESLDCLRAIGIAAGRAGSGPSRIVVTSADATRPNDFR